jgi:hypothetical protein
VLHKLLQVVCWQMYLGAVASDVMMLIGERGVCAHGYRCHRWAALSSMDVAVQSKRQSRAHINGAGQQVMHKCTELVPCFDEELI